MGLLRMRKHSPECGDRFTARAQTLSAHSWDGICRSKFTGNIKELRLFVRLICCKIISPEPVNLPVVQKHLYWPAIL
jgi:hypothetical protein